VTLFTTEPKRHAVLQCRANKLELTTSIVPWCNPHTRTIPTQTENVPFGLRAWFDCALV